MTAWLVILLATTLLCVGLILIRRTFQDMAYRSAGLLNALLDSEPDELVKQRLLIRAVGAELRALGVFLLLLALVLGIAALPVVAYLRFGPPNADPFGGLAWTAMLIGGVMPFVVAARLAPRSDYSEWSKLLHRMVLDHPNLELYLFRWEARRRARLHAIDRTPPLLVSGLARAGTTALTTLLARSPKFHSLTYASMPFLLSPVWWSKLHKPSKAPLKERSHGDRVLFGYDSVEALEEHFFKVFLKNGYIRADHLVEHTIDAATFEQYVVYRNLVGSGRPPGSIYLAKNNNALLRYASLRALEPGMKAVFLFRSPLDHAHSLMKQHERYVRMQHDDPFVKEYMDWLGHHEFGAGLKHFAFDGHANTNPYGTERIEHWVQAWIDYYERLLEVVRGDANALLIDYADFLAAPERVVRAIGDVLGTELPIDGIERFENTNRYDGAVDDAVRATAIAVFDRLKERSSPLPQAR